MRLPGLSFLLDEHLVRLVADERPGCRPPGWDPWWGARGRRRPRRRSRRVERAGEELVVRPVDGVTALERDDVLTRGEHGAHLGGVAHGNSRSGRRETLDLAADVVLAALHGDHGHAGVLDGGGTVAHLRLQGLVGLPLGLDGDDADVLALVLEQHLVANLGVLAGGVEDDGHAKEKVAAGQAHLLDAVSVHVLVHEARERAEATHGEQLDVARVPVGELEGAVARGDDAGLLRLVNHEVHELAAVGLDETGGVRRGGSVEEGLAGCERADEAGASLRGGGKEQQRGQQRSVESELRLHSDRPPTSGERPTWVWFWEGNRKERIVRRGSNAITMASRSDRAPGTGARSRRLPRSRAPRHIPAARFFPSRGCSLLSSPARGVHQRGWRGRRPPRRRGQRWRRASRRWWRPGGENGGRHSRGHLVLSCCEVSLIRSIVALPAPACAGRLGFFFDCLRVLTCLGAHFPKTCTTPARTLSACCRKFVASATFLARSDDARNSAPGPSTFPMSYARRALKPVAQYGGPPPTVR